MHDGGVNGESTKNGYIREQPCVGMHTVNSCSQWSRNIA